MSPNSETYYAKRIETDISNLLKKWKEKVTYGEMVEILQEIGFVSESKSGRDRAEDCLMLEMWNELAAGSDSISKTELIQHLMSIMGCAISGPGTSFDVGKPNDSSSSKLDKATIVSGARTLSQKYALFNANRLNSSSQNKKEKVPSSTKGSFIQTREEFTFSPKISTTSARYAETARQRLKKGCDQNAVVRPIKDNLLFFMNQHNSLRSSYFP